jgi:hypothetical protein
MICGVIEVPSLWTRKSLSYLNRQHYNTTKYALLLQRDNRMTPQSMPHFFKEKTGWHRKVCLTSSKRQQNNTAKYASLLQRDNRMTPQSMPYFFKETTEWHNKVCLTSSKRQQNDTIKNALLQPTSSRITPQTCLTSANRLRYDTTKLISRLKKIDWNFSFSSKTISLFLGTDLWKI